MRGIGAISFYHVPSAMKEHINRAIDMVDSIDPINHDIQFGTCSGYTRAGVCQRIDHNHYKIRINEYLKKDGQAIFETTIHELLHSYPDTFADGHKGMWIERAITIYQKTGVQIERCANDKIIKIISDEKKKNNVTPYVFTCSCGNKWHYIRKPRWYDIKTRTCHATCRRCGSTLESIGK